MRLDRYVDGRKVSKCAVFTSRAGNQIMAITVEGQVMLACCDVCRCFGEQFSLDSCRREDVKHYVCFDAPRGRNGVAKKTIFAPARLLIGYIRTRYPRKNTEIVRWIQTEIVPAMSYEQKQETEVAEQQAEGAAYVLYRAGSADSESAGRTGQDGLKNIFLPDVPPKGASGIFYLRHRHTIRKS